MVAEPSNMEAKPEEDLTTVMFRDDNYLARGLSEANVFEYFAMSQFYDPQCNNQKVRMQNLDESIMATMAGIEYQVKPTAPNLFIVSKLRRELNPPSTELLATFYIFGGNIYQVPTLHAILSSRLLQALHYVRSSFAAIHSAVALAPNGAYTFEPAPNALDEAAPQRAGNQPALEKARVTNAERSAVSEVLYDVLMKNRSIVEAQENAANKAAQPQAAPPGNPPPKQ